MRLDDVQWETIVEMARQIDDRAAARRGLDVEAAVRLSRAVLAFDSLLESGHVLASANHARPDDDAGDRG